ncbi:MAG: DUF2238 domain-containing protein [Proteobacteria bacterium]|nr:DUF2238 domain-containing protein [Pseudomonadota bacterium]
MATDEKAQAVELEPVILALLAGLVLVWSGIGPADRLTWWLEVAPVVIAVPLLAGLYRRVRFTALFYRLVLIHAVILMVGGHYTYANVPFGFWLQDLLDLSRNHYDRIGHFAQGFIPAIVTRELLVRWSPLKGSKWLPFLVICVCLAFSAFYELIEWWGAAILGQGATEFLGTQGDIWDSQWDMFWALIGAGTALVTLSRLHDRGLAEY